MNSTINWVEAVFEALPLPLLEVWGRFGYLLGFVLMVCAFGSFTFRPGGRWGLGRERQAWDAKALLSSVLTFVLILFTGYLGSFIVLVPGAQTFESLKDLSVFVCILLFGYPALIIVPFAYGLSDLIEGVPPNFLQDWLLGYFINPACFWVAYQLIGKNPDFRQIRTWSRYLLFVLVFMSVEPQLWGYICSGKFTPEISYRNITPALFFTTSVTWIIAPFAMLVALPLARKFSMFWAEIPGHVKERVFGRKDWIWEAGTGETRSGVSGSIISGPGDGLPIRMFLVTPFIALVLVMVGASAYLTLSSAEHSANKLATRLHQEISENINLYLDDYLEKSQNVDQSRRVNDINNLLRRMSIAEHGRAFIVDRAGRQVASADNPVQPASFASGNDLVVQIAVNKLKQTAGSLETLKTAVQFQFDIVTAKPLSRETWLAQATPYEDRSGETNWILMTAMPAAYYLEGVRTGNSRFAMVFAAALTLSLVVAAYLSTIVTNPICRISHATQELMKGDLTQRVPDSRLEELGVLSQSFNKMAEQLQKSFDDLLNEVEMRKKRERELEESQARVRFSENRLQLATRAAHLGIWDWDVAKNELLWDDAMYLQYGISRDEFGGAYEAWSSCLAPEDFEQANADVAAALRGEREFVSEFRIRWPDGSIHYIKGIGQTIRSEDGRPLRMVGVNFDITEQKMVEQELRQHRDQLEKLVAERTRELRDAVQHAEAANRAKSLFLSNMSHEIRTPMNAILGYTQLMQRLPGLPPDLKKYARIIDRSGDHLLALINDVLEMSKIEAGQIALESEQFNVRGLLRDIESMLNARAKEKGLSLKFDIDDRIPEWLQTDPTKLQQVLVNIIGNAIKFTDRGSITVRATVQHQYAEDITVSIDITDTGPGIAESDMHKVFGAFEQAASGREKGGTGLGMTISRQYARMMGGDLTLTSEVGKGTTAHFTFNARLGGDKVHSGHADKRSRIADLAAGSFIPKILLVDDVDSNREVLRFMLAAAGFTDIREATDGNAALSMVHNWQPDLVLMDRRMPGMDGLQATHEIRALPQGRDMRIVMVTASAFEEDRQAAIASGADGFISKPFREEAVLNEIQRLFPDTVYRRENEQAIPQASARSDYRAEVAQLDTAVVTELVNLIECGDVARFEESLTNHVLESSPALHSCLRDLVEKFDYTRILSILSAVPTD